ncbi:hypothetical protein F4806DRAFT_258137 [Annulohypoxylon nitens]|nr:hypothetical protein F4806DRAFT_258137 [Annulohypoxylon nitens]
MVNHGTSGVDTLPNSHLMEELPTTQIPGGSNEDLAARPPHGLQEALAAIENIHISDRTTNIQAYHSTGTNEPPSLTMRWKLYLTLALHLYGTITSLLARTSSALDMKSTIRFINVVFAYLMGIATTLSALAPSRSSDALPSVGDDGYPVMIAQVVASMLSPLLFSIVSTKEISVPLRQKIASFYYLLLVASVFMSIVSLLLYSLWPLEYRVINLTMMANLMLAVLGGWQYLEKCWKQERSGEDPESGLGRT